MVLGVYGTLAVLGVGGMPRISHVSFPFSRVGEESLSESSDTEVLSASLGRRAQMVRPRLAKMMALRIVSISGGRRGKAARYSQHDSGRGEGAFRLQA